MSHSSLSAQLASLNTKKGSAIASKRHEDATGRGLHHSANAGHSLLISNPKFKPSVVHADARVAAAADVPFTTLRENAVLSLNYLVQHSSPVFQMINEELPWGTLFGPKSTKYERGLNTPETNAKFDRLLKQSLILLGTAWGDSSLTSPSSTSIQLGANIHSSVLHALEYLIQKYYVHYHNGESLLLAFLPHHETFLFDRILQLVDLSSYPHWNFLRPYSASTVMTGVPRTTIAKWAASTKDNGGGFILLQKVMDLAKRVAKVHVKEGRELDGSTPNREARRGTSVYFSFAAAIVAEALHIQHAASGVIDEATIRALVPFILGAIEPSKAGEQWSMGTLCGEWRSLGYIQISFLLEKCDFSHILCESLSTGIVKGAIETMQLMMLSDKTHSENDDEDLEGTLASIKAVEVAAESIMTMMSIISMDGGSGKTKKKKKEVATYLPIITSSGEMITLGYEIAPSTFEAMVNFPHLSATLGYLAQNRNIDVKSLVASLTAMAISTHFNEKKKCNSEKLLDFVIKMTQQDALFSTWKEKSHSLIKATTIFILGKVANFKSKNDSTINDKRLSSILDSIRALDPASFDSGIAYTVKAMTSIHGEGRKSAASRQVKMLLNSMEHNKAQGELLEKAGSDENGIQPTSSIVKAEENSFDSLLPPRIALEHPNAQIRVEAVGKLLLETSLTGENRDEGEGHFVQDDIAGALLSRYVFDDDALVAATAAKAVTTMYSKNMVSEFFFTQPTIVGNVITGLYRWTIHEPLTVVTMANKRRKKKGKVETENVIPSAKVDVLIECLGHAGAVAKELTEQLGFEIDDEFEDDSQRLSLIKNIDDIVLGIINIINSNEVVDDEGNKCGARLRDAALKAMLTLAGVEKSKKAKRTAEDILCQTSSFLCIVERFALESDRSKRIKNHQLLWFFLESASAFAKFEDNASSYSVIKTTALSLLNDISKKQKENDDFTNISGKLEKALNVYGKSLMKEGRQEELTDFITSLASPRSSLAFQKIAVPVIERIEEMTKSAKNGRSSTLGHLLEISSRPALRSNVTQRLIQLIHERVERMESFNEEVMRCTLVMTLAFLGHSDLVVRESGIKLLLTIGSSAKIDGDLKSAVESLCSILTLSNASVKESILMDGSNALPQLLRKAAQASTSFSRVVLECCVSSVVAVTNASDDYFWSGNGYLKAVSVILTSIESVGEVNFALSNRWKIAGMKIFEAILSWKQCDTLSAEAKSLLECVVSMMKGIVVEGDVIDSESGIVISTGPSGSGRRRRSYSIGMSDDISFIDPYPEEMRITLSNFLSKVSKREHSCLEKEVCNAINSLVVGRQTWSQNVFSKFDQETRQTIALSLLSLRSVYEMESAGLALLGLPLNASEYVFLANVATSKASSHDAEGLLAFTFLTDCIRNRISAIKCDQHLAKLSTILFGRLSQLSQIGDKKWKDGSDYTRSMIINTLLSVHDPCENIDEVKSHSNVRKSVTSKDAVSSQAKLLVSLVGGGESGIRPLLASKSKSNALRLITYLCSNSPTTVVGSLVPALISTISVQKEETNSNTVEDALMAIVPAFCKYASTAGLSLTDLLKEFMDRCSESGKISTHQTLKLFSHLADALISFSGPSKSGIALATVTVVFLSLESHAAENDNMEDPSNMINMIEKSSQILKRGEPFEQVVASLQIFQYIRGILPFIQSSEGETETASEFFAIDTSDLRNLAVHGKLMDSISSDLDTPQGQFSVMQFILNLVELLKTHIFALPSVKRVIRNSDGQQGSTCLNIWQELMTIQSLLTQMRAKAFVDNTNTSVRSIKFLDKVGLEISLHLTSLQKLLPVPHFLASVSSMMLDEDADVDIQRRAISLLAERAVEMTPESAEADLFLEMVPDLVKAAGLKHTNESGYSHRVAILQQAALRALDQLAKALGLGATNEKIRRKRVSIFKPALNIVTSRLGSLSSSIVIPEGDNNPDLLSVFTTECQVLSSTTMCASTLVTLLKAQCLKDLPNIVKPLISMIESANRHVSGVVPRSSVFQTIKLIQLSALRNLITVVETLPQFFISYVPTLLSPCGLPCSALRENTSEEDISVRDMALRLDHVLASRSPVRQLIPLVSKSIIQCFSNLNGVETKCEEALVLLNILGVSINKSSRKDLGPLVLGKTLNALIHVYGFDCKEEVRNVLLEATNSTLLSLVMKLSEVQLKPLYAKLREWKGVFDETTIDRASICRRYSFWNLSAAMSKELRSIFLPSITHVFDEIVVELEYAAKILCQKGSFSRGFKRQKINEISGSEYSLSPLQPLLLCLESALKADAHEGGSWIRNEEGKRFNAILSPLGKLLHASLPQQMNIECDVDTQKSTSYEKLVLGKGTDEYGNVISCVVALASAAGNEQLWKPLNHALLEACGNEQRSEVRRAGIQALLSVIKTLGEEYMVLLPECLPVLSELLEDEDEEIIGLAKACIREGEELLGESLEESLR